MVRIMFRDEHQSKAMGSTWVVARARSLAPKSARKEGVKTAEYAEYAKEWVPCTCSDSVVLD